MARINIVFDSRQVAGWEQMLGGRTCGVTLQLREKRELTVVQTINHKQILKHLTIIILQKLSSTLNTKICILYIFKNSFWGEATISFCQNN